MDSSNLQTAVVTYRARQERREHPEGRRDNGGRWRPTENERQECCNGVRSPTRAWPWSLMLHCRTAQHIANLYGVDASELRKAANKGKSRASAYSTAYKLVARSAGRYLSIYDGVTEYRIGETLQQSAQPDHNGGYYVYRTASDAYRADLPRTVALPQSQGVDWVVMEVRIGGKRIAYENGKRAVSELTPVREMLNTEVWREGDRY